MDIDGALRTVFAELDIEAVFPVAHAVFARDARGGSMHEKLTRVADLAPHLDGEPGEDAATARTPVEQAMAAPPSTPRQAARALLVQVLHDANLHTAGEVLARAMREALEMLTAPPGDACLSLAAQVLSAAVLVSRYRAPAGRVRIAAQIAVEALHLECGAAVSTETSREAAIASFDALARRLVDELEALDTLQGVLQDLRRTRTAPDNTRGGML